MNLLLKTIILAAAVGSAIPLATPPQQQHDATKFNHNILDHGYINDNIPPPEDDDDDDDDDDWIGAEFDKCNLSGYWKCLKKDGLKQAGCEAVLDGTGQCRPDVKRLIEAMIDDEGRLVVPGRKLIRRDPDTPLDEVEPSGLGGGEVIDDFLNNVHKGPVEVVDKGPDDPVDVVSDRWVHKLPPVTGPMLQCFKGCRAGPEYDSDEHRKIHEFECVGACIKREYPDYEYDEWMI